MTWQPIAPERLDVEIAGRLVGCPGLLRVAVDGPACTAPADLAQRLAEHLRVLSRPAVHLRSDRFWRDASVRLERGRRDPESYVDWLDSAALEREVLVPIHDRGEFLPALRDPQTDRSTHAAPVTAAADTVLLVSGELLLGRGLPFDFVIHLAASPAARARRTPGTDAWTLPAFDTYEAAARPVDVADIVIKLDDPARPAVRGLS